MSTLSQLTHFLLKLDPARDGVRLALYNYLKNTQDLESPLTTEVIRGFFLDCLRFNHWQNQKANLEATVLSDLNEFCQLQRVNFPVNEIMKPHEIQVIEIESSENYMQILKGKFEKQFEKDRVRFVPIEKNKVLALRLDFKGHLHVQVYSQLAFIEKGFLSPIPPETDICYNARLDMVTDKIHRIQSSQLESTHFRALLNHAEGTTVNGIHYQKQADIDGPMNHFPNIFYPLKALERHFIKRESDPFYNELASILEKCTELLKSGHPDGEKISSEALKRGRMALKNIFPNDKLLQLLVSNLEHHLRALDPHFDGPNRQPSRIEEPCPTLKPLRQQ